MKKIAIMLSFFFLIAINTQAQEIIENPEKPLSKTAGRVLELQEVLRIRGMAKDSFLVTLLG